MSRTGNLITWLAAIFVVGFFVAFLSLSAFAFLHRVENQKNQKDCDTIYITISAAEVCSASANCSLSVDDVEKYLRARKVYGECLREGAYD